MALTELLVRAADALTAHRFRYMVIGGMAVSTWAEPRLTRDVDLVVGARRRDAPRLKRALLAADARVTGHEMRLRFDRSWVRLETGRRGGTRLDVHVAYAPHDRAALENARPVTFEGRTIPVATPEDLVLYKLQAWREHDQLDARTLLAGVRDIDRAYIESWLPRIEARTGAAMHEHWRALVGPAPRGSR